MVGWVHVQNVDQIALLRSMEQIVLLCSKDHLIIAPGGGRTEAVFFITRIEMCFYEYGEY